MPKKPKCPVCKKKLTLVEQQNAVPVQKDLLHEAPPCGLARLHVQLHRLGEGETEGRDARRHLSKGGKCVIMLYGRYNSRLSALDEGLG